MSKSKINKKRTYKKRTYKKRTNKKRTYKKKSNTFKNRSYSKRSNKNSITIPIFEKKKVDNKFYIGNPKNGSGISVPGLRELL